MSESQAKEEKIKVIIRIKPEETKQECFSKKISNNNSLSVHSENDETKEFFYDYIADEKATQNEIFENCAKKICDDSLEGKNCTIFAYGQTGSGKTYTLLGKSITNELENKNSKNANKPDIEICEINNYEDDEGIGLIQRILNYLFENSSKDENKNKFVFKMSYMEIYLENIIDLLNPNKQEKIEIREDNEGVINITNLCKLKINSSKEAIKYIIDGNHLRHTASTLRNLESSRSHAIFTIYIENNLEENKIKKSVFHIIDLAGSESQKTSGTTGVRLQEGGSNNKSLLVLTRVITNIISNKKEHIPYRDSKLTRILKDSLGGNAKTAIIATISQLKINLEESKNTLDFAQKAKKVKNYVKINEIKKKNDAKIMEETFEKLKNNYNLIFRRYEELQRNHRNTIQENENISQSLEAQNKEIKNMIDDISKKEDELKKYKEENENLKDKIIKNDISIKLKEDEINTIQDKLNDLKNKNLKITEENLELKNQIDTLNKKIKKSEKEKLDIDDNNPNLINQDSDKDLIINELKEKIKFYEEQLNKMKQGLNEPETKSNGKKNTRYKKEDRVENSKKLKKIEKTINALKDENDKLKSLLEEKQKSISEYLESINSMKKQKLSLEGQIQSLSNANSNL